jgi:DNA (cytosine-5)-methyltransferase 1
MKKFKFIDLFSGLGGFRIALEKANGKCVFSSEIDKDVAKVYFENFGDYPSGDITKIDEKTIPDFDILAAGFPCQAFSIAGKRLGFEDTRGTLFFDIARILKEKQPKGFILENVNGITNHDNGKTLEVIIKVLDEIGYNIKFKVLNSKNLGLPQSRLRWYCVGVRKDLNFDLEKMKWPVSRELTKKLPEILEKNVDSSYFISETAKQNILKNMKKNFSIDNFTIAYDIRPSRTQFKNDGISPCLTAKMGTGGNNIPVLVLENRKLTERECLRLMGYPETYKLGKGQKAYKQIGNSIVLPVVSEIAVEFIKLLGLNN